MVRHNKTKAKIRAGEVVYGVTVGVNDPNIVELAGALGFDFACTKWRRPRHSCGPGEFGGGCQSGDRCRKVSSRRQANGLFPEPGRKLHPGCCWNHTRCFGQRVSHADGISPYIFPGGWWAVLKRSRYHHKVQGDRLRQIRAVEELVFRWVTAFEFRVQKYTFWAWNLRRIRGIGLQVSGVRFQKRQAWHPKPDTWNPSKPICV